MKKSFNNRKKTEGKKEVPAQHFQSYSYNPDKERIEKSGNKSPDIKSMPFRVQQGKTIRFFATEEKYRDYLKKHVQ